MQKIPNRLHKARRRIHKWRAHWACDVTHEHQRYLHHPQPYKYLKNVRRVVGDMGHGGIKARVANDPTLVMRKVRRSIRHSHHSGVGEFGNYQTEPIYNLRRLFKENQHRAIHNTPFTLQQPRGGRTIGPYADSHPFSSQFQGGVGGGGRSWGGPGPAEGEGGTRTPTYMA